MKQKRYSPEQIIRILKEAEAGYKIIDLCCIEIHTKILKSNGWLRRLKNIPPIYL